MQQDLDRQQSQWQATMGAILKRAESQWDSAFRSLDSQHMSWQSAFTRVYEDRAATWDASYVKLETGKADWVKAAAQKAATVGSQAVLSELGQSAEGAIRDASSLVVSDLGLAKPDARSAVAGVLQGKDFASLLASGKLLNRGISSAGAVIFAQMGPDIFDNSLVLHRIASMNESSQEQIDKHVLMIAASQARKAVFDARDSMAEHIDKANQSVADGLERSLLQAGFVRSSDHFERQTVVDSTISGALKELHVVPAYEPYKLAGGITTNVDLSDARLESLSASGIQAQVQLAVTEMRGELTQVFGEDGAKGSVTITTWETKEWDESTTYETTYTDGNGRSHTVTQTGTIHHADRNQASAQADVGGGEFGVWVGVAPEMDQKTDGTAGKGEYSKYLSATGTGQMGDVLTPFMWSQMKEGVGWAMVAQPIYDQKLWDDRGQWIKAPTIRSVADVGLTVAGAMLGGVPGLLLGMADDALFTTLDVSNGRMTWDEGLVSFGKKAVVGLATSAIGGAFGNLSSGITEAGLGGVIGKTMLTGVQGFSTNLVAGAINSITYKAGGQFGFDNSAFTESIVGQQAIAGYIGSMAQSFTVNGLNGALGGVEQGFWKGAVGLAGSAASTAASFGVSYAVSSGANFQERAAAALDGMGGISLNLLDVGALYGMATGGGSYDNEVQRQGAMQRLSGTGLLEMRIGSHGATLGLGTGGISVMGDLYQLGTGLATRSWAQREAARQAALNTSVNAQDVYQTIGYNYTYGNAGSLASIARMMSGTDRLHIGFDDNLSSRVAGFDPNAAAGVTVADAAGHRDMYLGSLTSGALGAVAFAHEAQRNGTLDAFGQQQAETAASVIAHTQMAAALTQELGGRTFEGNAQFQTEMAIYKAFGATGLANYADDVYSSDADYWLLKLNGTLVPDGSGALRIEYYDENGTLRVKTLDNSIKSQSLSLVRYLGQARAKQLFQRSVGNGVLDVGSYDDQTLVDVLGIDKAAVAALRSDPALAAKTMSGLHADMVDKLMGEALMKAQEMSWDAKTGWTGPRGVAFTFTDTPVMGRIAIAALGNGQFERFTVTADVERRTASYRGQITDDHSKRFQGLDRIVLSKRDLFGNVLDTLEANGVQTVDDMFRGGLNPDSNSSMWTLSFGTIQGSTIAPGSFYMKTGGRSDKYPTEVFVINNAWTMDGQFIGPDGRVPGEAARWLGRPNITTDRKNTTGIDFSQLYSEGCIIAPSMLWNEVLAQMNQWRVYSNYDILSNLRNRWWP